jgi:hypothetical protein
MKITGYNTEDYAIKDILTENLTGQECNLKNAVLWVATLNVS